VRLDRRLKVNGFILWLIAMMEGTKCDVMVEGQFLARPHSSRPCPGDRRVPNFCALEVHRRFLLMMLDYFLGCLVQHVSGSGRYLGNEFEGKLNRITDTQSLVD
jgi:hypothetical protein